MNRRYFVKTMSAAAAMSAVAGNLVSSASPKRDDSKDVIKNQKESYNTFHCKINIPRELLLDHNFVERSGYHVSMEALRAIEHHTIKSASQRLTVKIHVAIFDCQPMCRNTIITIDGIYEKGELLAPDLKRLPQFIRES